MKEFVLIQSNISFKKQELEESENNFYYEIIYKFYLKPRMSYYNEI